MEKFDFFQPRKVEVRSVPSEGTCPACSVSWPRTYTYGVTENGEVVWKTSVEDGRFVKHHWFEPDGSRWEVYICIGCNFMLSSRSPIALGDHVFPSWEAQVAYIVRRRSLTLGVRSEPSVSLGVSSEPSLYQRRTDLSLLRSWLGRRHTVGEVKGFGMSEEELIEMVTRRVALLESRLVTE